MNPLSQTGIERISHCNLPDEMIGGISIIGLASLKQANHKAMEIVEFTCAQGCGTVLRGPSFFAPLTSCDACRAKAEDKTNLDRARSYWESICPESYRETDIKHTDFPTSVWAGLREYVGGESLFLFGPSRTCKTRIAMLLLKRCLVRFNKHVGVMWEEDVEQAKTTHDRKALILKWGRYDVLLIDDALLTGARDERTTAFLKQIIDYRMRHNRHTIITSQVGNEEYKSSAQRDGLIKKQDEARIDALINRVREVCRVVSFSNAVPSLGEQAF